MRDADSHLLADRRTFRCCIGSSWKAAARRVDNSIAGDATTWTVGHALVADRGRSVPRQSRRNRFARPRSRSCSCRRRPRFSSRTIPATRTSSTRERRRRRAAELRGGGHRHGHLYVECRQRDGGRHVPRATPTLQSETADSRKTIGVVLRPRWVPKLNISVDYIDISLNDAIETLTLASNLLTPAMTRRIIRTIRPAARSPAMPRGQITNFHAGYVNAGILQFTGIQAALDYTFDLPRALGSVETSAHYLDTQQLKSQIGTASPNRIRRPARHRHRRDRRPDEQGHRRSAVREWRILLGLAGHFRRFGSNFEQSTTRRHRRTSWAWPLVAHQFDRRL